MNFLNARLQRIARLGLILMMGVSMSACSESWKEEVLLHDGGKLIVERSQTRGGRHEIGQGAPIKEYNIVFTTPNSNIKIEWKSKYSNDVGRANLHPLALHVKNGVSYIITEPNLCLAYNKWGRPNPPYVIFKHDGKEWQRITMQELPVEFKDMNLVNDTKGDAAHLVDATLVTAEAVKRFNSDLTQPELKIILREQVKHTDSQTNCPIPSTAAAKLITPIIDGKPLYYNWWPLAQDWLDKTYGKSK